MHPVKNSILLAVLCCIPVRWSSHTEKPTNIQLVDNHMQYSYHAKKWMCDLTNSQFATVRVLDTRFAFGLIPISFYSLETFNE